MNRFSRIGFGSCLSLLAAVAEAQQNPPTTPAPTERLQALMNGSQICTPLKMSLKDAAALLNKTVSGLIPDTAIGIDKNDHRVTQADVTDTAATISGNLGCVPSDQAVPFKPPFNLNPSDFRLGDNFRCTAVIASRQVTTMTCTTSGAIGQAITQVTNLNDQMKQLLQQML